MLSHPRSKECLSLLQLRYVVLGLLPLALLAFNRSNHSSRVLSPQFSRGILESFVAPAVAVQNSPLVPTTTAPQSSPVPVSLKYSYYPIQGMSDTELRSQMTQRGPLDTLEGRRYDANTTWVVKWSYTYKFVGNRCAIDSVKTHVEVTYTLPQWKPAPGTSPSLVAEWNHYLGALHMHEDGHRDHGVAAAQDVMKKLKQMPPAASCRDMGLAANKAAQQIIRRYNQKDIEYDQLTRHGSTQGAVFPVLSTGSR
jgi:predicted secreted Zn-dependent protease